MAVVQDIITLVQLQALEVMLLVVRVTQEVPEAMDQVLAVAEAALVKLEVIIMIPDPLNRKEETA